MEADRHRGVENVSAGGCTLAAY